MTMKTRSLALLAVCGLLAVPLVGGPAQAHQAGRHCAFRLVPESHPKPHVISARLEKVGCYDTFSEAIESGSGGATRLPPSATPASLADATVTSSVERIGGDTLIGTEFNLVTYGGSSRNYFAPDSCAGTSYEVDYVGDAWNDEFASGKGFGGCDTNKKFAHASFAGTVLTCTPNCSDYGALRNEVSSLKWKP
jgi:hypothetical protein